MLYEVITHVCERNNIDASNFNFASSAKYISGDDSKEIVSDDELEALIKSMQG